MSVLEAARSTATHTTPSAKPRWRFSNHAEILLVSFAALLIEISYTRIVSYKLFYYYVYLVIGLALLGIGSGGVLVAISKRLRRASADKVIFWSFLLGSASTVAAYVIVAYCRIDTLAVWQYGTFASVKSFLHPPAAVHLHLHVLRRTGSHRLHPLRPPPESRRRALLRRPGRGGHRLRRGHLPHHIAGRPGDGHARCRSDGRGRACG